VSETKRVKIHRHSPEEIQVLKKKIVELHDVHGILFRNIAVRFDLNDSYVQVLYRNFKKFGGQGVSSGDIKI
jgi:transposase